jgi:hypothetical protein
MFDNHAVYADLQKIKQEQLNASSKRYELTKMQDEIYKDQKKRLALLNAALNQLVIAEELLIDSETAFSLSPRSKGMMP